MKKTIDEGMKEILKMSTEGLIFTLPSFFDQVRKNGVKTSVCFECRFISVTKATKALVDQGQIGEIYTRGLNVFAEYYKNPGATKKAFIGDWCTVGDMGYMDEEGFVYLVDRKNDMIISGGENIYPREVEEVLFQHPAVADAAVIGIPDEKFGEAVKAIVVLRADMTATVSDLMEFCKGRLGGYKRPRSIDFTAALPRNPSGRVLKRELREPYWKGQPRRVG